MIITKQQKILILLNKLSSKHEKWKHHAYSNCEQYDSGLV